MLTWEQWQQKSKSSLEASRVLLENGKPVEAASRAYYAVFQMVTSILIRMKLKPREEFGNWSHHETLEMYRTHLCRKSDMEHKEKNALVMLRADYRTLLITRYKADYHLDEDIDMPSAQNFWRNANRMIKLLENLVKRGVL